MFRRILLFPAFAGSAYGILYICSGLMLAGSSADFFYWEGQFPGSSGLTRKLFGFVPTLLSFFWCGKGDYDI